jgi:hypothetical protein
MREVDMRLKLPEEGMVMPDKVRTRWPAGVMRVTCDGRCSMDLAYFREPTVAALEFTGATKATVECGLALDDLSKSELVSIAKEMGIDHAGLKAAVVARIKFDDTGNLTRPRGR